MSDPIKSSRCALRRPALVKHDAPGYYQPYRAGNVEVLASGAVRMQDVRVLFKDMHFDELVLSPNLGDIGIEWGEFKGLDHE